MTDERDKGVFSADIPEAAIAEALAAVEKREPPPGEASEQATAPAGGEIDRVRAALELSQEGARKVFEQLKDEHEKRLRGAADLENYKKRAAKERDEVFRFGIERLVKELLPVLDSLDRALAAASSDDPLRAGVDLTRRMFEEALARFGAKPFSAKGQPFDPRVHEALMTATVDAPPGTVVEEQQRGWFLHDRLIRPAAVVVSAGPAPAAGADGAPPEEP